MSDVDADSANLTENPHISQTPDNLASKPDFNPIDTLDPLQEEGYKNVYDRICNSKIEYSEKSNLNQLQSNSPQNPINISISDLLRFKIYIKEEGTNLEVISLHIMSENDLFFYFTHTEDYALINKSQDLAITFEDYIKLLTKMINTCINSPNNFYSVFKIKEDMSADLIFFQNLEYRLMEVLTCGCQPMSESTLHPIINYRYKLLRTRVVDFTNQLQGRGFINLPSYNAANFLKNQELNNYSDFGNDENTNRDYSSYNQTSFPKRTTFSKNKYVNNVTLLGNIGTQLKFFEHANGKISASFHLATVESWRDMLTREYKAKNYWHSIIIYSDHIIRNLKDIFKVGDRAYVNGALKYTIHEDQHGKKTKNHYISVNNYSGNVILLGRNSTRSQNATGIYNKINPDYNDSNDFNNLNLDTDDNTTFDHNLNEFDQEEGDELSNQDEEQIADQLEFDQGEDGLEE